MKQQNEVNIDGFFTLADNYRTRATKEQWKKMLLNERDRIIVRGHIRQIIAKSLGAGVVELTLRPKEEGV